MTDKCCLFDLETLEFTCGHMGVFKEIEDI